MKKIIFMAYSIIFLFYFNIVESMKYRSMSLEVSWYCALNNIEAFGAQSVGVWKNNGIMGQYSSADMPLAIKQLKTNYDVESMLGYCREYFISSQKINTLFPLREDNISSEELKIFYQKNVEKIKHDLNISESQAQQLSFVVCANVNWKDYHTIVNSFLGNKEGNTISMGLTHRYTIEDAYIILHMRPYFWFFRKFNKKEQDMYTNLIAGALNRIIHIENYEPIILGEHFNRQTVLKSVVEDYFNKFIIKK